MMFGERLFGKQNLKANYHLLHSQGCEKIVTKNGVPPELKSQDQKPHLPSRHVQEHPFTDYPGPDCFLSHSSSPNESYTDRLNPLTARTDTMPKQPPSCLSETNGENNSHSEDLDVKPGSQTSSQASSKGSPKKRKSSSSDEDCSHKSLASREATIGSKAMVFISETEDTESFNNHKSKHNGLGFKDTKNQEDGSVNESRADKSDVDKCSVKLLELAQEEPQRNSRLKKIPITIKEKEQSLSDHSSTQDEDDSDQTDSNKKVTSERDGEMSNQDITRCSSVEGDHISGSSPSSSDSSENASSEWHGGEDNIKVCKSKQDNANDREDSDSEDIIVSPQDRPKIIHVIPERVVRHQDSNSKKTSSDDEDPDDSHNGDDIEHVLAPPAQTQR
ncbi:dentin sialophosphoprotein-like [Boleophthalmus pectinirostris]|uniref:dentin sialophosphoprotein-like n=1 Tax=Boleophthalmus pectinirostris TaxID=150288 RepID=UPI002430205E|nr:dentin sialophosphoprotein-like [Boleophthalmus pectinirostris]